MVVVLLFYVHGKHLRACRDGRELVDRRAVMWSIWRSDMSNYCKQRHLCKPKVLSPLCALRT